MGESRRQFKHTSGGCCNPRFKFNCLVDLNETDLIFKKCIIVKLERN